MLPKLPLLHSTEGHPSILIYQYSNVHIRVFSVHDYGNMLEKVEWYQVNEAPLEFSTRIESLYNWLWLKIKLSDIVSAFISEMHLHTANHSHTSQSGLLYELVCVWKRANRSFLVAVTGPGSKEGENRAGENILECKKKP